MTRHRNALTQHERRAIYARVRYGSAKSAAQAIHLSHHTVLGHCKTAFRKLGVHDISGAAAVAIRDGWLAVELKDTAA